MKNSIGIYASGYPRLLLHSIPSADSKDIWISPRWSRGAESASGGPKSAGQKNQPQRPQSSGRREERGIYAFFPNLFLVFLLFILCARSALCGERSVKEGNPASPGLMIFRDPTILDPFDGAKRRSGSTLSKPRYLCRGVEGLTKVFFWLI